MILAFEPQITDWLERDRRIITPPPDARPLSAEAILAKAREARPDVRPTALTLRADPTASAVVSFGREGGALFVDQYRGVVLGGLSPVHDALHEVVEWHRWLGSRENLRPVTGAANLGFLGLVVVGVYLWWPRRWTREAVQGGHPVPRRPGRPRARLQLAQRDRHLVRARAPDPDAHRRDHVLPVGQQSPLHAHRQRAAAAPAGPAAGRAGRPRGPAAPAPGRGRDRPRGRGLDALWARAERQVPGWVAINARLPQRPDGPVTFFIQEPVGWHPTPRSQLVLDPVTAEVVKWEPFAGQNMGRRLRAWVRPLHTGEAGGIAGQTIAFLASAGGAVLVWTGIALAWRRFRSWRRRAGSARPSWPRRPAKKCQQTDTPCQSGARQAAVLSFFSVA